MNVEKSRMAVKGIRHLFYGLVFLFAVKLYESYSLCSHYLQSEALGRDLEEVYGGGVWMHSLFYFFLVHVALVILAVLAIATVAPVVDSRGEIRNAPRWPLVLLAGPPLAYLGLVAWFFATSPSDYDVLVFGPLKGWIFIDSLLILPMMAGAALYLRVHSPLRDMAILSAFPVAASLFGLAVALLARADALPRITRAYLLMFFNLAMLVAAVGFSTAGGRADIRLDRLEAGIDKLEAGAERPEPGVDRPAPADGK